MHQGYFMGIGANIPLAHCQWHYPEEYGWNNYVKIIPANCRSRSVTVCLTCALNSVSQHKINTCVELSVWCVFHVFGCALSVYHLRSHIYKYRVRVCLLCVYVEFTLLSNMSWTWKFPEHTLAPVCWDNNDFMATTKQIRTPPKQKQQSQVDILWDMLHVLIFWSNILVYYMYLYVYIYICVCVC